MVSVHHRQRPAASSGQRQIGPSSGTRQRQPGPPPTGYPPLWAPALMRLYMLFHTLHHIIQYHHCTKSTVHPIPHIPSSSQIPSLRCHNPIPHITYQLTFRFMFCLIHYPRRTFSDPPPPHADFPDFRPHPSGTPLFQTRFPIGWVYSKIALWL
jgi:hypothetical protein